MNARSALNISDVLLWALFLAAEGIRASRSGQLGRFALVAGISTLVLATLFFLGRWTQEQNHPVWLDRFYSVFGGGLAVAVIAYLAYEYFW